MIGRGRHRRIKKRRRYERSAGTEPVRPCGNFSDTSFLKVRNKEDRKADISAVRPFTEGRSQATDYDDYDDNTDYDDYDNNTDYDDFRAQRDTHNNNINNNKKTKKR